MTTRFRAALDYEFADPDLLRQALTHPSAPGREDNVFQRLEFLGDRVLGLTVAEMLLERFPTLDEGGIGLRMSMLVSRNALIEVATAIGLDTALIQNPNNRNSCMTAKPAADACEAVIAALYLDGGLDAAQQFVRRHWLALVERHADVERDPRTRLQEWSHSHGLGQPVYTVCASRGDAHRPEFEVEAVLANGTRARGAGGSKRAAAAAAAAVLLERLE
ncbi:MAG: ribonuclease III [Alphaproteobacteria bacterium]|nr:ribonuclease III [Alphaproteobacteria bacterium]MCY4231553.1 ribonuclease III [Alphaproteobacteria bacterium]MCY4317942.1 ribonuclease III [Alphaproteobacteria bacterium]